MRDQEWLENRLEYIQRKHFADADISNPLFIKFGRKAITRLGSIKKKHPKSIFARLSGHFETEVTINSHFMDPKIPEFVIDAIIGHELCHYVHGFSSPLPQLARHPHRGGIVNNEMRQRGMGDLEQKQKKWIKQNWLNYINKHQ